ncbi:MAG: hypothetical protein KAS62_07525 [Candidatus Delongbacteria bacterium]|nr:hypothetical protein [Candidatus Delongbacteria bacterium]
MQNILDEINIILPILALIGLFIIIYKKKLKIMYEKLPKRLRKFIKGVNKRIRFIPLIIIMSLFYFCYKAFDFSGDGKNIYREVIETPIEEVDNYKGSTQGFTDVYAKFSFQSNKYVRLRNIEKYKTLTDTSEVDSMEFNYLLQKFKGSFRNDELNSSSLKNVIIKRFNNRKTKKERRTTRIDCLLVRNKGLYFFIYSWG